MVKEKRNSNKKNPDLNLEKDQHLLEDKKIIEKEISLAEVKNKDKIIEVGGGKGYLTKKLAESKASKIRCFEIDKNFKPYLDKLEKQFPDKLKIRYKNALKENWEEYNKIISNIPYSLSEPLIQKAIESEQEKLVLIVGEKFKEKLTSINRGGESSTIGIIANLFYNVEPITKIPKDKFTPPPETNSWLMTLTKKSASQLGRKEKILQDIIQYNGKIKNAIIWSLIQHEIKGKKITKNQAREIIKNLGLNKQVLEKPTTRITGKFIQKLKKELPSQI